MGSGPSRLRSALGAGVLAVVTTGGCVADRPEARPAPPTAEPGLVSLAVSNFEDTDGDGLRDMTVAIAYIFADSLQYAIPLRAEGEFRFELANPADSTILARWTFDKEATRAARRDLTVGPGFVFELTLANGGADLVKLREAALTCVFTPVGSNPVGARESKLLQVGRR